MKKIFKYAGGFVGAFLGVFLLAHGAYAVLDFVEGHMIPATLKNGYTFTGDNTFSGGLTTTPTTLTTTATVSNSLAKYDVSAAGGAYTVSLPNSTTDPPDDGQCWEFSMTVAGAAVKFSPSAVGDLLDASQAAYAGMDALGDSATICYDSGTTNYYFQSRYIH